jgi:hypothetical protein
MKTKRTQRAGRCAIWRNELQRCRRRTKTIMLAQTRTIAIGEADQAHWEYRCSQHKDKS